MEPLQRYLTAQRATPRTERRRGLRPFDGRSSPESSVGDGTSSTTSGTSIATSYLLGRCHPPSECDSSALVSRAGRIALKRVNSASRAYPDAGRRPSATSTPRTSPPRPLHSLSPSSASPSATPASDHSTAVLRAWLARNGPPATPQWSDASSTQCYPSPPRSPTAPVGDTVPWAPPTPAAHAPTMPTAITTTVGSPSLALCSPPAAPLCDKPAMPSAPRKLISIEPPPAAAPPPPLVGR
eukprot:EG_transcript_26566